MIAKTRRQVKQLESKVAQLRPASAPGILTNRTTRGVTRKPIAGAADKASTIPRYL